MKIIGISSYVHDSAASLVVDGKLVLNAEEERFNRERHTRRFPEQSLNWILQEAGVKPEEIDAVAFNWNPWKLLYNEVLFSFKYLPFYYMIQKLHQPPVNYKSIFEMLLIKTKIRDILGPGFKGKTIFIPHHLAHASCSYYLSPYSDSDIIVVDGYGERCSTSVFNAHGNRVNKIWSMGLEQSVGILYRNFTKYLGFNYFQEGTLMALASYGNEDTYNNFFDRTIKLESNGRYRISRHLLGYWSYMKGFIAKELGPPRESEEQIEQRHRDIAASFQTAFKRVILNVVKSCKISGTSRNLCLSGGCFLNCDTNSSIINESEYDSVFIPPFTSDTGGAAGAALACYYKEHSFNGNKPDSFTPYLGRKFDLKDIDKILKKSNLKYSREKDISAVTSRHVFENKIVGWFQGREESGPRALGNRSILASPFHPNIKNILNHMKKREAFRPFAPVVAAESAEEYFHINRHHRHLYKYMLITCSLKKEYRDILQSVSHVDGSSRIQIVDEESNRKLYKLLQEFKKLSGYPVLINTSFNVKEPMVGSPENAIETFLNSELNLLAVEDYLVRKP